MDTIDFISRERLRTYEIQTDSRERAVALHNHTLQLGSSLMAMIALLELSIRNSVNARIIADFGDHNWLVPNSSSVPLKEFEDKAIRRAVGLARKSAYSKLSYQEKGFLDAFAFPGGVPNGTTHQQKVKKRQALFVVSHGQIISQTTFHFWKRLFASEYEAVLWKKSLKKVFPNKKLKRSQVSSALEAVYATRNRVAHHEPVYGDRLDQTMEALDFLREALGATGHEADTEFKRFSRIHHLRLHMDYESFLEAWNTLT